MRLVQQFSTHWYWKARFFSSSVPSNNNVFRFFLNWTISSSILSRYDNAFHSRDPLYSNMRFPYFVLNVGVFNRRKSSVRPLKGLKLSLMFSEHIPLTTLNTIRIVLNMTRDSIFNQWSWRRASRADSLRRLPRISLAAAFCTFCSLNKFSLLRFRKRLLQ